MKTISGHEKDWGVSDGAIRCRHGFRHARLSAGILAITMWSLGLHGYAVEPETPLEWEAKTNGALGVARFSFWLPKGEQAPPAVLVLLTGLQGDGRGMVKEPAWQDLARKHHLALMGCYITSGRNNYYEVAKSDQGRAVFDALQAFGGMSQLADLEKRPLLLWGISAGGQYAYNFACLHPGAVMTFVVNVGGYYDDVWNDDVLKVPAIFFYGQKDAEFRIRAITSRFAIGRRLGAPWCLVAEPDVGHAAGCSVSLSVEFFDAILAASPQFQSTATTTGSDVPDTSWLGDLKTHEIFAADSEQAREKGRMTSWLPNKRVAEVWQTAVSEKSRLKN